MKNLSVKCQGDAKSGPCGNYTTSSDARCSKHKNTSAHRVQQSSTAGSKIPRLGILKPKQTSDDVFNKPHYRPAATEPIDYSDADSVVTTADTVFSALIEGIATADPYMVAAGTLGIITATSEGMEWLRERGIDVRGLGFDPNLKETRIREAAAMESRRIVLPSEDVEAIVKKHWDRLEDEAVKSTVSIRDVLNNEDSGFDGTGGPAALYRSFKEQFYALAAEPDPAGAAWRRADEIEARLKTIYDPASFDSAPFKVSDPYDKGREAIEGIIRELRAYSNDLFGQSIVDPSSDDE